MGKFQDLTGMLFGDLLVLGIAYKKTNKLCGTRIYWRCRCLRCGNECIIQGGHLKDGHNKTCGCGKTTHGMTGTPIYNTWHHMLQRCENPNLEGFDNYGGRGIKVCQRWHDFQNFYDDVSKLPHFGEIGYSLDRINNDGDYCPQNVRWATNKEQQNNKRNNFKVILGGEEITISQAAEISGINRRTLSDRYQRGDRDERLFRAIENNSVVVEYRGEEMILSEAAKKSGINYGTLQSRYYLGLRGENLFRPVQKHNK